MHGRASEGRPDDGLIQVYTWTSRMPEKVARRQAGGELWGDPDVGCHSIDHEPQSLILAISRG